MDLKKLKEYGEYCSSWTLWDDENESQAFPCCSDNELLSKVNTKYVFVGLNPSALPKEVDGECTELENKGLWRSFHSKSPNDGKLKYVFTDEEAMHYKGCYITDIIKKSLDGEPFVQGDSNKVVDGLNKNSELIRENAKDFKAELDALEDEPYIIAFGRKTYNIIRFAIRKGYLKYDRNKVIFVYHFSYRYCGYNNEKVYKDYLLGRLGKRE